MTCFDNTTIVSIKDFTSTVIAALKDFTSTSVVALKDFSNTTITCYVFDRADLVSLWVTLTDADSMITQAGDNLVFTAG